MTYSYVGKEHQVRYPPVQVGAEGYRIQQQAMRWRVLNECWMQDARWREETFFNSQLIESMPHPDLSRNPAVMVVSQLATLYDEAPTVRLSGGPLEEPRLKLELLWALSQERHYLTEGINECLMRVDWIDEGEEAAEAPEGLAYRVVYPHLVTRAISHPERPDKLVGVEELRWKPADPEAENSKSQWVIEGWDLSDPGSPRRYDRFVDERTGKTVGNVVEMPWPDAYFDDGQPILPYVIYHRRVANSLWNPWPQKGLYEGTLTASAFWTFWGMGVRDASYDNRVLIDGKVEGASPRKSGNDNQGAQGIVADPRMILPIKSTKDGVQGRIDAWRSTLNVKATAEAIEQYMAGLALYAGVSPSDITLGSTNRSGYAIVVSRDGQRAVRRRQGLPNRLGDRQLLSIAARLLNVNAGADLPTDPDDYQITYAPIPQSPAERAAAIDEVIRMLDAGLINPVEAYMRLHPGTDQPGALQALLDIRQSQRLLSAAATPTDRLAELKALQTIKADIPYLTYLRHLQRLGFLDEDENLEALAREKEAENPLPPLSPHNEEE
ncbi:MAG: hypothetical protein AAFV53_00275 [Myxococcota bacterium]